MTVNPNLLDIICCPVTRQPLEVLSSSILSELNGCIEGQKIRSRDDAVVSEPLSEALVTEDGKIAYPVEDGIPVLLEERGIQLSQLEAS